MEAPKETRSRSLERLVDALEARIRAAAARFSLDESDVDEVIQDVRIRLWKARGDGIDARNTTAGYVYRTARTAALDLVRRRRRRQAEALPASLPAPERDGPAGSLAASEIGNAIHRALEGLPERRRPVVRMYLSGYSSGEIADLLGWTEAKARNLLYRGLEDLRRALADQGVAPAGAPPSERAGASGTFTAAEGPKGEPAMPGEGRDP